MASNLTALSDEAATRFGLQAAAADAMAAAASSAVGAMRESAARTAAMLDRTVAQNAMLRSDGSGAGGGLRYCRGAEHKVHFAVTSSR